MAPITTRTGIPVLDSAFGGLYLKRPTLVSGRRKTGKFVFAVQFLAKTLKSGESALVFTDKDPQEVVAAIAQQGVDADAAIGSGQLLVCPYATMGREGSGHYAPLPFPQALDELDGLVSAHSVSFAIFDSVVPWTAIEPLDAMPDHTENFVKSLERMGLTSLLLLPHPASPAAQSLANLLRELCPTNIEMESRNFGAEFIMRVTKYQGATGAVLPWEKTLDLTPGIGFGVAKEDGPAAAEAPEATPAPASPHHPARRFHPLVKHAFIAPAVQPGAYAAPAQAPAAAPEAPRRKFRPFVQVAQNGGIAIPQNAAQAPAATPPPPQTTTPPQADRAEAAHPGHQPLFSDIIDIPGFPAGTAPAARPAKTVHRKADPPIRLPVPNGAADGGRVSFSRVID